MNKFKNKQGGFLELIIFIVVAFLLMRYFDLTISEIVNWLKGLWNSVK